MQITATIPQLIFFVVAFSELSLFLFLLIQSIRYRNESTIYPIGVTFTIGGMIATFMLYGGIYLW